MPTQASRRGFTIVELLIVIVVIAVLAAISVAAYNGVRERATNAQVIAGVNTYVKALRMYEVDNGSLPAPSPRSCLGAGYPSNTCWMTGTTIDATVYTPFDTSLAPYLSTKPTLATSLFWIGINNAGGDPYMRAGALYRVDGGNIVITYYLRGINQTCAAGGTRVNEGGLVSQCTLVLAPGP